MAVAKAREEVARTLHDGVLQALAVIERRTADAQIAKIARDQERELRDFLFSANYKAGPSKDLGFALRAAVGRFEAAIDARVDLLLPDDLPALGPPAVARAGRCSGGGPHQCGEAREGQPGDHLPGTV